MMKASEFDPLRDAVNYLANKIAAGEITDAEVIKATAALAQSCITFVVNDNYSFVNQK